MRNKKNQNQVITFTPFKLLVVLCQLNMLADHVYAKCRFAGSGRKSVHRTIEGFSSS